MCVTSSCVFLFFMLQLGQNLVGDPRLKVFKREWFEGKDCLDIGCNSGMVTIQIGSNTLPDQCLFVKKRKRRYVVIMCLTYFPNATVVLLLMRIVFFSQRGSLIAGVFLVLILILVRFPLRALHIHFILS